MFQEFEQWQLDRLGKFTASETWKLVEKGKGGEYFGKGAKTYIRQKAAEILTLEPINGGRTNGMALEWGSAHEHEAVVRFQKENPGIEVIYYGGAAPKFFQYSSNSGGSPDGCGDDGSVLEIKCPFNSGEHLEHIFISDAEELKSYYPECYWQMVFNMICTDQKIAHFISYDPRFADESLQFKQLTIELNDEDADIIKERVAEAEKQLKVMIDLVREEIS
jgi:hypothetical protein